MYRYIGFGFLLMALVVISTSAYTQEKHNTHYSQFVARHDVSGDGFVSREEFKGSQERFEKLDKNADGRIEQKEFIAGKRNGQSERLKKLRAEMKVLSDLEYARVEGQSLKLDLYMPENTETSPPLIVWIHGGGWTRGDKQSVNPAVMRLVVDGYAVASINYRLGGLYLHPKQIHDCKGAIRWLRANVDKYGYSTERIAVAGGSAGAHLALLLGLSSGESVLEGIVGGNLGESSKVDAIIDLSGVSSIPDLIVSRPDFKKKKSDELIRSASPVEYLGKGDPPVLIVHGDSDQIVPVNQGQILHDRYQELGLDSTLHIIPGAGHGGKVFSDQKLYQLIKDFLKKHIGNPLPEDRPSAFDNQVKNNRRAVVEATKVRSELFYFNNQSDKAMYGFHWMVGPKTGIAGTEEQFQRLLQKIDRNLSTNPYIQGVYIIFHWNLIEASPGTFDFDRLDRVIERVAKHGRYFKLSINPGIYTPGWLYTKGAEPFHTLGSNPARKTIYQQEVTIPVPWDKVFQTYYFRMLEKVANRYKNNKAFRSMTLTVATFMGPEWHLPRSKRDREQWQSLEGFPLKLQQAWQEGIDRFATIFPNQVLVLEASSYPIGLKALGDSIVDYGARHYPGRFAVQMNQLTGKFDQSNNQSYRKIIDYKKKYGSDISIGFQNLKGWAFPKIREKQGSMEMTAYNFVQAGGDYWELWHGDGGNRETCKLLNDLGHEAASKGLEVFRQILVNQGQYKPSKP